MSPLVTRGYGWTGLAGWGMRCAGSGVELMEVPIFPAARGGQGAKLAGGEARSSPLTAPSRQSAHDREIDAASVWAAAFRTRAKLSLAARTHVSPAGSGARDRNSSEANSVVSFARAAVATTVAEVMNINCLHAGVWKLSLPSPAAVHPHRIC